jgi:hypothetical protein
MYRNFDQGVGESAARTHREGGEGYRNERHRDWSEHLFRPALRHLGNLGLRGNGRFTLR